MPIQIVGAHSGAERDAAEDLKQLLDPRIDRSSNLTIVVGARCYGFPVQDIDLLLLGTFGRGITFKGRLPETTGHDVRLINIALTIEVKDQSDKKVQFSAQHVSVFYEKSGLWEDATDQAFKQAKVVPKFIKQQFGLQPPWFESLVWLHSFSGQIPAIVTNVLPGEFTADEFFATVERVRRPLPDPQGFHIAFTNNKDLTAIREVSDRFRQNIPPTELDRKRLELICKRLTSDQKYVRLLGSQLLMFRGRGGSGKTIHLLRLAKDLYDDGRRALFLTFNKALVADIRRLLVILNISSDGFDQCIRISTAHSFFCSMLEAWGYWERRGEDGDFPEELYNTRKKELLQLISDETPGSIKKQSVYKDAPGVFGWDYVFIDEGQDWPEDERNLLFKSFGFERCVVADGVGQLIREDMPCDWESPATAKQVVGLRKALRMKSSLCRFIGAFADEAGIEWDQETNEELTGGRITILEGPYSRERHDWIFQLHGSAGNAPVDALFCVPPGYGTPSASLADKLRGWGYAVWDGTSKTVRDTFPTRHDEHRIVRYQSCRGLEGWTVICLGLDEFYEDCLLRGRTTRSRILESPEEHARRYAGAWALIPLTRAVDHLVIQLEGRGTVYKICRGLADKFPDFVSWRE